MTDLTYETALLHHVQRSLHRDLEIPMGALAPDQDGDIAVSVEDVLCFVRLWRGRWARVWVVAAEGLKPTVKVLREVNGWNRELIGARALLTDGGALIVSGELRAESLEAGELGDLVRQVATCAGGLGPLVRLVHGTPQQPAAGGGSRALSRP